VEAVDGMEKVERGEIQKNKKGRKEGEKKFWAHTLAE